MRFLELPRRLRAYILILAVATLPLGYEVFIRARPEDWRLVAGLLLFTVVFSTWKVELTVKEARMTPTFAVVCVALLLQGVQAALLCTVLGAFVGTLVRPTRGSWKLEVLRPHWYRLLFNATNCAIACGAAAIVFETIRGMVTGEGEAAGSLLGLLAFTSVYFLLNTLGVALAIALQQGLSWPSVWKENFLWTAPGFYASASTAALIRLSDDFLGLWSLLFLPPLYLVYYSYRLYMDRINLFAEKVQQDLTHIEELNKLNQSVIASLATAIDAKDSYTCSHINRVQTYAVTLAKTAGVSDLELEAITTGSLVHDIGKLGIPDHILTKPGKLTANEYQRMQGHVQIGAEILAPVPFPFPVVDVVLSHHERWDGYGYPHGLQGEQIPIGGRIISIVDVFDALTSKRPYRRAMTRDEALQILRDGAGSQFDPRLVDLFIEILPDAHRKIDELAQRTGEEPDQATNLPPAQSALSRISQAAAEMAAVCDVAAALADQENIDEIAEVVVSRTVGLLPVDAAVLYLRSSADSTLTAVAAHGKYAEKLKGMVINLGEGMAGYVAEKKQPLVNASATLDVARRFTPEESIELNAATAVPVVHGPEVLGVLAVYTMGYGVIADHHLNVLNIVAEHTAAAIQNARRFQRTQELALTDPLTGLANSRALIRRLKRLIYAGKSSPEPAEGFSVVMMDLDGFKQVNDTLGHMRGDDLLRSVAAALTDVARADDLACRYAGDEFVLLLPNTQAEQAGAVAERVRQQIEALSAETTGIRCSASIGVSSFPLDGQESRELLHIADQRMYEDKFARRQLQTRPEALPPGAEVKKEEPWEPLKLAS